MTPRRLIIQLETELAQVEAALSDGDIELFEREGWGGSPDWVDGYWYGRYISIRNTIHEIKELHD